MTYRLTLGNHSGERGYSSKEDLLKSISNIVDNISYSEVLEFKVYKTTKEKKSSKGKKTDPEELILSVITTDKEFYDFNSIKKKIRGRISDRSIYSYLSKLRKTKKVKFLKKKGTYYYRAS